jgi:hypothetical protein
MLIGSTVPLAECSCFVLDESARLILGFNPSVGIEGEFSMSTRHRKDATPLTSHKIEEMLQRVVPFERDVLAFMADVRRDEQLYVVLGILHDVLQNTIKVLHKDEWAMHLHWGDGGAPPSGKPRV